MFASLEHVRKTLEGTPFENKAFLVGGAVRDRLLGLHFAGDLDIVIEGDALEVAKLMTERAGATDPQVYPRFGTAMVHLKGQKIEFASARSESYDENSRKPHASPATLLEDMSRRDFTVNALMLDLKTLEPVDLLGSGLSDLKNNVLRTPLDPAKTFSDDPLRMLRAVRFRHKLGFEYADGLEDAIKKMAPRLSIISGERIAEELSQMLARQSAADALQDLHNLDLLRQFWPEFHELDGIEQGKYHYLDAWNHTVEVVRGLAGEPLTVVLSGLFHDVAKGRTRTVDDKGDVHFYRHDDIGAEMAKEMLRRIKMPNEIIDEVTLLVSNHMRLSGSKNYSDSAARRLIKAMGESLEGFFALVQSDRAAHVAGLTDQLLDEIKAQVERVRTATPIERLQSPLTGEEIMTLLELTPGPNIGKVKDHLLELVLEGTLLPEDKSGAIEAAKSYWRTLSVS